MTSIDKLKVAMARANELAASVVGRESTDSVQARRDELASLKKDELIELVLAAEKVKNSKAFTIENVAQPLLEDPLCACFTYEQIAATIRKFVPDAKTSAKGIASYVQAHKEDWHVVPRERVKTSIEELLAAVNG